MRKKAQKVTKMYKKWQFNNRNKEIVHNLYIFLVLQDL